MVKGSKLVGFGIKIVFSGVFWMKEIIATVHILNSSREFLLKILSEKSRRRPVN